MIDRISVDLNGEQVEIEFEFYKGEHGTAQMPASMDEVYVNAVVFNGADITFAFSDEGIEELKERIWAVIHHEGA